MSYLRPLDPIMALDARLIVLAVASMTFCPWLIFAFAPTSLSRLFMLWLPLSLGALFLLIAFRALPLHYRLFWVLTGPMFLLIPTNIGGHMLAHTLGYCYD